MWVTFHYQNKFMSTSPVSLDIVNVNIVTESVKYNRRSEREELFFHLHWTEQLNKVTHEKMFQMYRWRENETWTRIFRWRQRKPFHWKFNVRSVWRFISFTLLRGQEEVKVAQSIQLVGREEEIKLWRRKKKKKKDTEKNEASWKAKVLGKQLIRVNAQVNQQSKSRWSEVNHLSQVYNKWQRVVWSIEPLGLLKMNHFFLPLLFILPVWPSFHLEITHTIFSLEQIDSRDSS